MLEPERPSFEIYRSELLRQLDPTGELARAEKSYTFNMRSAQSSALSALDPLVSTLRSLSKDYVNGDPNLLFYPPEVPNDLGLKIKSLESVLDKYYRHNILYNRNFPNPPSRGSWNIEHLYTTLDDLLRGRLVCRYLDGPQFVCERLSEFCEGRSLEYRFHELSNEAGYYAWHFYFRVPVDLSIGGSVETHPMWVELQLTTQLAEVITALTHGIYRERRSGKLAQDGVWKWQPNSSRFRSSFIGHGLHLLEGVIQTFRDDVLQEQEKAAEGSPQQEQK